ncbi:MAG: site-specific tyrosine recombinase/integron integrase [Candidatus Diapherotrites archaeon]
MNESKYAEVILNFKNELTITGYSKRTLIMYQLYVKEFLEFTNKPVDDLSRNDIVNFLAHKKENNTSNATLALVYSSLKFFTHSFLKKKIMEDIKSPKRAKKLPSVLTQKEVKDLIKASKAKRDRLIVEFLYSSGCRVSECVKLKVNDLEVKERIAQVRGGKGNKDRIIILSTEWLKHLKQYLKNKKHESDFVFSKKNGKPLSVDTIQRIIKTTSEKAGIQKHVTPHTLRHSYATHLLESGESIRKIQELLGHTNLSTTQIYTSVSTEQLKKVQSPLDKLAHKEK